MSLPEVRCSDPRCLRPLTSWMLRAMVALCVLIFRGAPSLVLSLLCDGAGEANDSREEP